MKFFFFPGPNKKNPPKYSRDLPFSYSENVKYDFKKKQQKFSKNVVASFPPSLTGGHVIYL